MSYASGTKNMLSSNRGRYHGCHLGSMATNGDELKQYDEIIKNIQSIIKQ